MKSGELYEGNKITPGLHQDKEQDVTPSLSVLSLPVSPKAAAAADFLSIHFHDHFYGVSLVPGGITQDGGFEGNMQRPGDAQAVRLLLEGRDTGPQHLLFVGLLGRSPGAL